ncbi:ABC transporter ATP-binding protein [Pseudorhodoplanes sp.]|uniref:ABC transporter ATP-binding protein n=1 Tax=Pseudorhodoplanes sp. TaxID=1934341 RepID=UPI003D0D0683
MPLLEVEDLHVAYGELEVVRGISFSVAQGEIVTILGSNGAGKTTTLKCLAGLLRPRRGQISFLGQDVGGHPAHEIAASGMALVPEGRQLFPEHTVRENLELGAYQSLSKGKRAEFDASLASVLELFPRVHERLDQRAGLLSGGEQQMVAIARALVSQPKLLILDEPSLGLAPRILDAIFEAFVTLKRRGVTLLIVEQMAWLALNICDRAHVLESGCITLSGTGADLAANPRVMEAYLGAGDSA